MNQGMQWLLLGGPWNGKTLWVTAGSSVRVPHEDGEEYLYAGQNYLHDGRLYRLGVCHSEGDADLSAAPRLIQETGLQHIAGS